MSETDSVIHAITLPRWAIEGRAGVCLSAWAVVLVVGTISGGATNRLLLQTLCLAAALLALAIGPANIWEELRGGGVLLLVPALVGALQLVPLPRDLLIWLAPLRGALLGPHQSWGPLSLYPFATLDTASLWVVYALAFAFGGLAARRRAVALSGWLALVGVALAQAVYGVLTQGVVQTASAGAEGARFGMAHGTYPTRDQFACFLALVAPMLLAGLLLHETGWHRDRSRPELLSRLALRSLLLTILILGAVFSFSRGGLAALTLGFGVVVAIAALRARGHGRRGAAVLLLVAVAVAIAGTGQLVSQWMYMLHPKLLQADARWPAWSSAWGVVADHPLLGVGLGAFPTAFLPYAKQAFEAFFMDAHSEPLQLAIEIGLPATVALYAGLLVWIGRAFRAAKRARPGMVSAAALAGIAGSLTAFVLISLVDFPFHVPSNTLIAFTLAGYVQAGAKEILARERIAV